MVYKNIILILILFLFLLIISNKEEFKNNENNEKLDVAVIVEPREHKYLIPVVLNFIENLPNGTPIQIFHGTKNISFIKKGLNEHIESGKIRMTNLGKENLSIKDYNNLLTSKNFWNQINGENILIFQTDTCLCSKNKHKIYDFLKYDYVGAPWKKFKNIGGNGGLSFRKKSKMIEMIKFYPNYIKKKKNKSFLHTNEDVFFSSMKLNFPSKEDASNFSVEQVYNKNPFGIHKPWLSLSKENLNSLKNSCTELQKIFK